MNEIKLKTRQCGTTVAEVVTYILIVIVLASTAFGFYLNGSLNTAIADALTAGEEEKVHIEEYFQAHGRMPQSGAEAGLNEFTPTGVLKDMTWRPGVKGEGGSDTLLTGTLNGILDLSEFGERFVKHESGFLLVARAQDDGSLVWDCMADAGTKDALPRRYLPESCKPASDSEK